MIDIDLNPKRVEPYDLRVVKSIEKATLVPNAQKHHHIHDFCDNISRILSFGISKVRLSFVNLYCTSRGLSRTRAEHSRNAFTPTSAPLKHPREVKTSERAPQVRLRELVIHITEARESEASERLAEAKRLIESGTDCVSPAAIRKVLYIERGHC